VSIIPPTLQNTFGIANVLDKEIDRQKRSAIPIDFEMSLIPVALMMQLQGIEVDREKKAELTTFWSNKRDSLKMQLDKILGKEVNFNSSKQMQQLLYFDLGLPVQYKRRKSIEEARTMTTDANALRTLARLVPDNEVFNLILEYKKADLLVRNFLDIELSPEGKVHTSYNITGASSTTKKIRRKQSVASVGGQVRQVSSCLMVAVICRTFQLKLEKCTEPDLVGRLFRLTIHKQKP